MTTLVSRPEPMKVRGVFMRPSQGHGMKSPQPESEPSGMDASAQDVRLPVFSDPPAARRRAHAESESRGVTGDERRRIIRRLRFLGRLLDDAVYIPGTKRSIGLDPIIGLIPGIGDALSVAVSAYIIYEGRRLGASRDTIALMVGNVAIDALVGAVPVLGDLADFALKANQRNLRLLGIDPAKPDEDI